MRTWTQIKEYSDLLFEFYEGIAKITINRPKCTTLSVRRPITRCSTHSHIAASIPK